jgi:ATP-dependent RNA helicase RhlE
LSSEDFTALGASRPIAQALAARGVKTPFAIQRLVIPDAIAGRDVLAQSPTGSGKTLAFAVPIVESLVASDPRPSALVLAPTRELVAQIVEEVQPLANALDLTVAAVYGGVSIERQRKQARRAHILIATPGRLEDLLARRDISLTQVKMLVLDEADRMLDMGFRPAVDRIAGATPRGRQTLFFSATLDGLVGKLARAYTHDPRRHVHTPRPELRGRVDHRFVSVTREGKFDALIRELRGRDRGLTLVFVRTKRGADRLVKRLRAREIDAVAMHGNKTQSQREKALARFGSGRVDTLIATDVAARGLDIDDITYVINFDAPEDRDAYVHRVGRTGRAGRAGTGITFVAPDQAETVGRIADTLALQ